MSEIKLLPCPFCGGEAEIVDFHDSVEDSYDMYVRCKECGIQTREFDCGITFGKPMQFPNPLKYLVEAWNTRKPMERIVERLEEKTDFLKNCTKYGNKNIEQMRESYDTMMMYEVADLAEDLIDIVKEEGGMT